MSHLFWPKIFNRAGFWWRGRQKSAGPSKDRSCRPYYVKTYIGLGDVYWKTDDLKGAGTGRRSAVPGEFRHKGPLAQQGDNSKPPLKPGFDPGKRVDTNLKDLWTIQYLKSGLCCLLLYFAQDLPPEAARRYPFRRDRRRARVRVQHHTRMFHGKNAEVLHMLPLRSCRGSRRLR